MPRVKADKKNTINKVDVSQTVIDAMLRKNADDVTVLNIEHVPNTLFDKFIICTANSGIQAETISDEIIYSVRNEFKIKPINIEGTDNKEWILLDYFDVLIHIFLPETRTFFKLEQLWADAEIKKISID
ncbi:MAG: ribosome silencing factor [Bacteroidales bacterium]|nr:ribosome silencing factor [Bacteroidales bacterium]